MAKAKVPRRANENRVHPDVDDVWLGFDQTVERMNKTPRFVRRLVAERRIRHDKHGSLLAFKMSDVDEWLTSECREPRR